MIELCQVTKKYGQTQALQDLSFTASRGQIVGLLGQNGAGKTTALNILTGYMPPTSGKVLVDGMDMLEKPRPCKQLIGYLPEKPPLYDEMTVDGYLRFVCGLKGVRRADTAAHLDELIALCGLKEVRQRVIGHLSKGYRQRVGIAQALCGNPPVIVLDEPTVGLDPRQVVEIRELIRTLGEKHAVIFSSHLLPEIQQLCHRVVLLHQGKVIRQCSLEEMTGERETVQLRAVIALPAGKLLPALRSLPCVRRVKTMGALKDGATDVLLECDASGGKAPQQELFRLLCGLDAPLLSLQSRQDSLEAAFLRATAEDAVSDN